MLVGHLLVLEAKAPGVDQWAYGNIEGSIGVLANLLCLLVYLHEHWVERYRLVVVDARDDTLLVEHRQGIIDLLHFCLQLWLQVVVILVGDMIGGTEDSSCALLVGCVVLLADNEDSAHDEQYQKGNLPE